MSCCVKILWGLEKDDIVSESASCVSLRILVQIPHVKGGCSSVHLLVPMLEGGLETADSQGLVGGQSS